MKISIIIPVLNEEKNITKILEYIEKNSSVNLIKEIVIVDGGSSDNTVNTSRKYPNVLVFHSKKVKAIQMNLGASKASGEIVYFLHCDSFPPKDFDKAIVQAVKKGNLAGCFKMKFDSNHILLKVLQWFTKFNFRFCRGGDQSLFVDKKLFQELNGYREDFNVYEDNEFIFRLYEKSKFTVIQETIITSSRRYKENGYWKLQFHFLMIHVLYNLKIFNQNDIFSYYKKHIK